MAYMLLVVERVGDRAVRSPSDGGGEATSGHCALQGGLLAMRVFDLEGASSRRP